MPDETANNPCRIGLIVNPIAGMGGAVGLQGTDGERAAQALALGAAPVAGKRVMGVLSKLSPGKGDAEFLACDGDMGMNALAATGLTAEVVHTPSAPTSASDTREAARTLLERGVDILLFAGGDGTAAAILDSVGKQVPVLGIPAGVKMHSAVFAVSPRAAADILQTFIAAADRAALLHDAEVMDRPDDGSDAPSPILLGFLRVPDAPRLMASAKAAAVPHSVAGACRDVLERLQDSRITLLGPGRTLRDVKETFGRPGSLLGVDAMQDGRLIATDLPEAAAWDLVNDHPARIVISVVGGQGFLFGRGNQQLSARVIRAVGVENIIVISSMEKLTSLAEQRLLVDTGDDALDRELEGFVPVLVGYRKTLQMPMGLAADASHD